MKGMLLKAAPWALIVAAAFAWFKTEQARAREEGRNEVLIAQRDSVLAIHDSTLQTMKDTVEALQVQKDTVRLVGDAMLDTLLVTVQDTVLREQIRTVVDTIRVECMLCQRQVNLLQTALSAEEAQHSITRNLLAVAQRQRRTKLFTLSVQVAPVVYDVTRQQFNAGVFVSAGVSINIF